MANWGLMMGIGQGLQQVGGMLEADSKTRLAAKLSQEKELRDAAREQQRFDREQLSFDKTGLKKDGDGVLWEVDYAKNGKELDKRLASPDKLESFNMDREAASNKLKADALTIDMNTRKLEDYDEDRGLERAVKQSTIERNRDTGLAAITRATNSSAGKSTAPASLSEAADTLVDSYPDLVKEVTTAPSGETPLLSAADVQRVAAESVKIAAQRGQDAAAIFRDALRIRANGARKKSGLELDLGN